MRNGILLAAAAVIAMVGSGSAEARTKVRLSAFGNQTTTELAALPAAASALPRRGSEPPTDMDMLAIQRTLKAAGFDPGVLDGRSGVKTLDAIRAYRDAGHDMSVLGHAAESLVETGRVRPSNTWVVWEHGGISYMAPLASPDLAFPRLKAAAGDERSRKIREIMERHSVRRPAGWDEKIAEIRAMEGGPQAKAVAVQKWISKAFGYKDDVANEWKTPAESFGIGGDCDDYAMSKFVALRELGFGEDDLTVLSLGSRFKGSFHHVVVALRIQGRAYVLEMKDDKLIPMDAYDSRGLVWAGNTQFAMHASRGKPSFGLPVQTAGGTLVSDSSGRWYEYLDRGKNTDQVVLVPERKARIWIADAKHDDGVMETEAVSKGVQPEADAKGVQTETVASASVRSVADGDVPVTAVAQQPPAKTTKNGDKKKPDTRKAKS
ncbi:transglutaminase-like cysteine peptidase [Azospirillum sp. TSO5]|uniref:transglutaminase-like cysteine peptidase n=1 Tax=Azospirillum sp. TSO5 TaxID=716760 RepID=UPI000D606772|nr:transglutaminase-like cysteine peptidase [Azospirillum sp. TSO5]PWC92660.1 hypothetical protein TSO5_17225 [Azospirillum sp. TSO5]